MQPLKHVIDVIEVDDDVIDRWDDLERVTFEDGARSELREIGHVLERSKHVSYAAAGFEKSETMN